MKLRTITQSQKPHNVNQLHDAFIAAGLIPRLVESTETESRLAFDDVVADSAIDSVVSVYALVAAPALVDVRVAWQNYKNALQNATTVAQIKSALTNELGTLLKELLRAQVGNL